MNQQPFSNSPSQFRANEEGLSHEEVIQQLRHEIQLRERYERELEESRRQAERAAQCKSQFLANMSHEIRTPLGLIMGFTEELIKSTQLTPENRYLIQTIQRNSEILIRLIDDILDLSKIEAGKIQFDIGAIRTTEFLKDLNTNLAAKCAEKHLDFHQENLTELPPLFYSDEVRIKQILFNLFSNGIKYTDKGGLVLKASYVKSQDMICFDVIDTGVGIPLKRQSEIFEFFKQLHRGKPGSGLGLALSRDLARGLGGDVKLVRSREGEGTWFRVEIKNQLDKADTPLHRETLTTEPPIIPDLSGWKVLIVDDLVDNIHLIEAILRPTKALVDSTMDPYKVLTKVLEIPFDLVLLDLQMPDQDGYETIKILRDNGYKGEVWAISAYAMTSDKLNCLEAGFNNHISKPIKRSTFYGMLNRLVHSH